ncbi:Protein kinase-like domain [Pseudocohnilembus persalinus]|uniref:Protein kinase-like domain n=1 Tax=Pseudocohnilembus persalinus TaxID=266149 RepID=A0A0V0Q9D6_PSEPJ|nr:Protein kinase-like domain [Pseudocohnilembus persalinus]|eukprot:KRW98785.1 Protein kinase-like domain [Pseudocohnilembus persalinus]
MINSYHAGGFSATINKNKQELSTIKEEIKQMQDIDLNLLNLFNFLQYINFLSPSLIQSNQNYRTNKASNFQPKNNQNFLTSPDKVDKKAQNNQQQQFSNSIQNKNNKYNLMPNLNSSNLLQVNKNQNDNTNNSISNNNSQYQNLKLDISPSISSALSGYERGYSSSSSFESGSQILDSSRNQKIIDISMLQSKKIPTLETTQIQKKINEVGMKKINNYTILKEIGRGTQGKVKKAIDEEGKLYAIKIVNKNKLKKQQFNKQVDVFQHIQSEVKILKQLTHPNITQLIEVLDDPQVNKICMVFEYMEMGAIQSTHYFQEQKKYDERRACRLNTVNQSMNGNDFNISMNKSIDLSNNILNKTAISTDFIDRTIPQAKVLKYYQDLVLALDYMHNYAKVVHRDIKPPNLLINKKDQLKVSDFGVSILINEENKQKAVQLAGSWAFLAPECWQKGQKRSYPMDIWAAGVTLYKLVFGNMPFKEKNRFKLRDAILNKEVEFPKNNLDPNLIDFIKKCLDKNQVTRINAKECLVHPWITQNYTKQFKNTMLPLSNLDLSSLQDKEKIKKQEEYFQKQERNQLKGSFLLAIHLKRQLTKARHSLESKLKQPQIQYVKNIDLLQNDNKSSGDIKNYQKQ